MFGLCDCLAVQFEHQFRVAGLKNVGIHILMAGDATVGSDVKILQIPHAGMDAVLMREIRASMGTQPIFGTAVATFARNTQRGIDELAQFSGRNCKERRMADDAVVVVGGVADLQGLRDAGGASHGESREGWGVKIVRFDQMKC